MAIKNFDFAGIGLGPANLSLAALTDSQNINTAIFLDKRKADSMRGGLIAYINTAGLNEFNHRKTLALLLNI